MCLPCLRSCAVIFDCSSCVASFGCSGCAASFSCLGCLRSYAFDLFGIGLQLILMFVLIMGFRPAAIFGVVCRVRWWVSLLAMVGLGDGRVACIGLELWSAAILGVVCCSGSIVGCFGVRVMLLCW
ncbi:hypothetical protein U1Q18_033556 [Sarracenia purpurea var. burkii]